MECSFSQFWSFERELSKKIGSSRDDILSNVLSTPSPNAIGDVERADSKPKEVLYRPLVTFQGSNDFHHLSLALIRRIHQPFNLVRIPFPSFVVLHFYWC
jgi:hypothetical protein